MPAASWVHRVDRFYFQFWAGDPPSPERQQVETFQRAGVASTGFRLLGKRGEPISVQLTEHFLGYALARKTLEQYRSLIGVDPVEAWHNYLRLKVVIRTVFAVLDVEEVECQANVRLLGPGYNFLSGAALVSRWKLLPIAVSD